MRQLDVAREKVSWYVSVTTTSATVSGIYSLSSKVLPTVAGKWLLVCVCPTSASGRLRLDVTGSHLTRALVSHQVLHPFETLPAVPAWCHVGFGPSSRHQKCCISGTMRVRTDNGTS